MSPSDLNTLVSIIVGILTALGIILGAGIVVVRTVWTYRKNQREAHMSKVQNRVEYLKEQMETLQNAYADWAKWGNRILLNPQGEQRMRAIALAKSVMLSVGDNALDLIAERLQDEAKNEDIELAFSDGIKRLARIIQEESTK